jgi:Phosphodiester glycosidase
MSDLKTLAPKFYRNLPLMQYGLIFGLSLIPLLAMGCAYFRRPLLQSQDLHWFEGIHYRRTIQTYPRPMVVHTVGLDLKNPNLKSFVTPPLAQDPQQRHTAAQTTSAFLQKFRLQLAINGSFFYHFEEDTPWDYKPRSGDRVWVMGTAISDGKPYPKTLKGFPSICFTASRTAQIVDNGRCPANTQQALSGNEIFVRDRKLIQHPSERARDWLKPYPRAAIALDRSGQKLWILLVDGKQPFYSEGITMPELAELALNLGATTALNLDGGGSVTLAMERSGDAKVLNTPIHAKIPTLERPIANHLGFYAKPLASQ